MPTPYKFRLNLVSIAQNAEDVTGQPFAIAQFDFEAFPTASCTLAQHFASRAWYQLQELLTEPQEGSPSETR